MRFLDLPQQSDDWAKWRRSGIGASEAPIIMGISPWSDPLTLWKVKTGRQEEQEQTFAMRRGLRLEPIIRRLYQEQTGIEAIPVCVAHEVHQWMRASLDGMDSWGDVIQEMKAPNLKTHLASLEGGTVPDHYEAQIQHQLYVSGASRCDYVSYSEHKDCPDSGRLVVIPVSPDRGYQSLLVDRELAFWTCILEDREPEMLTV